MANLKFYVDTTSNSFIAGLTSQVAVDVARFPLYFGDTISLRIYLFDRLESPTAGAFPFVITSTTGLTLFLYLDDGTVGGTIYTQQITWSTDAANQYFYANLALNTAGLQTLLGSSTNASCWLKIGFVQNGLPTTVISKSVTVNVGLPSASVGAVPAGQTALSVETGNATYLSKEMENGEPIFLKTDTGKRVALYAYDDTDGGVGIRGSLVS